MPSRLRCIAATISSIALLAIASRAQFPAYLLDAAQTNELYGLHPHTGQVTVIGAAYNNGMDGAFDLAWKSDSGELWCIENVAGDIGTLSAATAQFTPVAHLGLTGWYGIAWDEQTRLFYLSNDFPIGNTREGRLYSFDPATQITRLLGVLPRNAFFGLDVDAGGQLWGLSAYGLFLLDKRNAQATFLCTVPASTWGLSIDRSSGAPSLSHRFASGSSALSEIEPLTGRIVHSVQISGPTVLGFTFVEGICPGQPSTYGNGCAGTGGYLPLLDVGGCIGAGQSARIELSNVVTGSSAFAFFGTGPGQLPLGDGCDLLVSTPFPAPILPVAILGSGGAGRGFGVLEVPIPGFVAISPFAMQAAVIDRGVARGYALSNGVRVDVR